jgi:hypothetical protein
MPRVFHLEVQSVRGREHNDMEARDLVNAQRDMLEAVGGHAHPNRTFGIGPAIIVLVLPDRDSKGRELKPEQFFPGLPIKEVTEAETPNAPPQGAREVLAPVADGGNSEVAG